MQPRLLRRLRRWDPRATEPAEKLEVVTVTFAYVGAIDPKPVEQFNAKSVKINKA